MGSLPHLCDVLLRTCCRRRSDATLGAGRRGTAEEGRSKKKEREGRGPAFHLPHAGAFRLLYGVAHLRAIGEYGGLRQGSLVQQQRNGCLKGAGPRCQGQPAALARSQMALIQLQHVAAWSGGRRLRHRCRAALAQLPGAALLRAAACSAKGMHIVGCREGSIVCGRFEGGLLVTVAPTARACRRQRAPAVVHRSPMHVRSCMLSSPGPSPPDRAWWRQRSGSQRHQHMINI